MIGIGPYPITAVIFFAATLTALLTATVLGHRHPAGMRPSVDGLAFQSMVLGMLAARLGFIAQWWESYAPTPMAMLSIGDGGFAWWAGLPAALAWMAWRSRHRQTLRRPVLISIAAGVLVWGAASGLLALAHRSAPALPKLALTTLSERPVQLHAYLGKPVVLNLWASWCPPCRREMPALLQAQAEFPDVAFVMINQGEQAQQAQAFLAREQLDFQHVLLDPRSEAMRTLGSRGLPTTLFFDAAGKQVHAHLGELTLAAIKSTLTQRFPPPSQP